MSIEDQPPPVPNTGVAVWQLVMADMLERDKVGRARYGTPLQTHNGRDMLVDAYQEALDLVVYLRGAIEERAVVNGYVRDRLQLHQPVEAVTKWRGTVCGFCNQSWKCDAASVRDAMDLIARDRPLAK